jgi:hypothetical protein
MLLVLSMFSSLVSKLSSFFTCPFFFFFFFFSSVTRLFCFIMLELQIFYECYHKYYSLATLNVGMGLFYISLSWGKCQVFLVLPLVGC